MISNEIRVLGLALYGPQAASHRIRLGQFTSELKQYNINLQVSSLLDDNYVRSIYFGKKVSLRGVLCSYLNRVKALLTDRRHDVYIIHCELLPLVPAWFESLLLKTPYIYDFDDAFYLKYSEGKYRILSPVLGSKFSSIIKKASAVTAGSQYLADRALVLNSKVFVLPSSIDVKLYTAIPNRKSLSPLKIGWIGTPSTEKYLQCLVRPLSELAKTHQFEFICIGARAQNIPGVRCRQIPWSIEDEVNSIREFDIGVMPLPDDNWSRGKCGLKLIQYQACGLPVVASRVGANLEIVKHDTGYLVESCAEWVRALGSLLDSPSMRASMGFYGRLNVEKNYSTELSASILASVIREVYNSNGKKHSDLNVSFRDKHEVD